MALPCTLFIGINVEGLKRDKRNENIQYLGNGGSEQQG